MPTTEEAQKENEARAVAGHGSGPKLPVHHPQASYVPPDLSFIDGVELDDKSKAWAEERDSAREEAVEAAVESEKKVLDEEAQAREEASEKAKEARDKQIDLQAKAGVIPAPTPTAEEIAAEKRAGGGTKKS
jgi:hypothetical protein